MAYILYSLASITHQIRLKKFIVVKFRLQTHPKSIGQKVLQFQNERWQHWRQNGTIQLNWSNFRTKWTSFYSFVDFDFVYEYIYMKSEMLQVSRKSNACNSKTWRFLKQFSVSVVKSCQTYPALILWTWERA